MAYKVIYLTGAPATGKSTICSELRKRDSTIELFEYGTEMTKVLSADLPLKEQLTKDILRQGTSGLVTQRNINFVDDLMIKRCVEARGRSHVIIDSHHVTREPFGFRVSAFTPEKLTKLNLTEIWALWTSSNETLNRLKARPQGRIVPTAWEADLHTTLQLNLASNYGCIAGVPVLMFDSTGPISTLAQQLYTRLIS